MSAKLYDANWLSNMSVAAFIIGGFGDIALWQRFFALILSAGAFYIGRRITRKQEEHQS